MEVIIRADPDQVADTALEIVREALGKKPDLVLGLAAGGTPLGLYRRICGAKLDFTRAHFFSLDEYVGPGPEHPESFHRHLHEHLVDGLHAPPARVHFLRGDRRDMEELCGEYEEAIRRAGGIDLQILGLGANGHIAFNEPGSSLGSRTRVKTLSEETRAACAGRFLPPEEVPQFGITMGVGTILEARRLLVLATGRAKAGAVRLMTEGPVTAEVPGSALQLHPRAHIVVDEEAASGLARREYWKRVHENKWRVE